MDHPCDACEYIFDLHFTGNTTHLFTKQLDGSTNHYKVLWHPIIYVAPDPEADFDHPRTIYEIAEELSFHPQVLSISVVNRYLDVYHDNADEVLAVEIYSIQYFDEVLEFAEKREYELYNTSINMRQKFFLEFDIAPMTACHIEVGRRRSFVDSGVMSENKLVLGNLRDVKSVIVINDYMTPDNQVDLKMITQHEKVDNLHYQLPEIRVISLQVNINKSETFPSKSDPINQVTVDKQVLPERPDFNSTSIKIDKGEKEIIHRLLQQIHNFDPDVVDLKEGDRFMLEYLSYRAKQHQIALVLDRLGRELYVHNNEGQTYHSYGQIYRRDPIRYLAGRLHLDLEATSYFIDEELEDSFYSLVELSRLSHIPLSRTSRVSIGTVLTGIELYINQSTSPPTLVHPTKAKSEVFKPAEKLLVADNGGLIYPGPPGIHDNVWAIDFTSMYPFIMLLYNISSETVLCEHKECNKHGKRVPSIDYHICRKRIGVVPKTMRLILKKRISLKRMKESAGDEDLRSRYSAMDSALKWILVSCFGYLGFKNAIWGSIESHQCVTAYARKILAQAKDIAEKNGFDVLAGITDSLFIRAQDPEYDTKEEIEKIIHEITRETSILIDCEGKFEWMVICSIKDYDGVSALNRYFGKFTSGKYKLRGIRVRQRRITPMEDRFQMNVLDCLSKAESLEEMPDLLAEAYEIYQDYRNQLLTHKILPHDLIIKLKSTRGGENYAQTSTVQALATKRYGKLGKKIRPGMMFSFLVYDDDERTINRVRIKEEVDANTDYDSGYYITLLHRAFEELTEDIQKQFYGKIIYEEDGVPQSLDGHFEESPDSSTISPTTKFDEQKKGDRNANKKNEKSEDKGTKGEKEKKDEKAEKADKDENSRSDTLEPTEKEDSNNQKPTLDQWF